MARKKRASGEGTIRKRPNGLWEARLSISGQYRTKSFYGKTQAEARRKCEEARKTLEAGHSLDSQSQTVSEYLEGWIEGPLKGSVAPKTYADYAWICRKHLIPEIGRVRLSRLTAEDLDRLYARKTAADLGPDRRLHTLHRARRSPAGCQEAPDPLQRRPRRRAPATRTEEGENHPLFGAGCQLLQGRVGSGESLRGPLHRGRLSGTSPWRATRPQVARPSAP